MGTQKMSGLTKRGGTWHIDKVFRGTRIRESTGTGEIVKAQELLAKRIDEIRAAQLYGARPDRTFRVAATKFLNENQHKRSIDDDALHLAQLDPFIGNLFLKQVHLESLQPFIASRRADGVKTTTINLALGTVRRILNLAASEWRDERGMTWLEHAAKIKLLPVKDKRAPYPLSREEQAALFQELPDYLARMSLFKVNTGVREQEVCGLKWADEIEVPELNTSVFIIEGDKVKNGQDRLVVLNRVARSVIDSVRGQHPEHVFVRFPKPKKSEAGNPLVARKGFPLTGMNTTAWQNARVRAADKWKERTGERGGRWLSQSAGSRSEAHVRPAASRGGSVVRRSSGSARPQEQSDHDALLLSRAHEPDSCGGEGLRWRVPQFPRNHLVTATSGK